MNKAFFFDRDGIVNEIVYDLENDFAHTPLTEEQVIINPNIADVLRKTRKLGYLNILVSNQPNIALKKSSKKSFLKIRNKIKRELKKQNAFFDKEYYCFHHPYAKLKEFRINCKCRKPSPGLLLKAKKDLNIDLQQSFNVGDGATDVVAGYRAGCKTILVTNALESGFLKAIKKYLGNVKPDFIVKNVKEIPQLVLK